jgi:hypothetical protein
LAIRIHSGYIDLPTCDSSIWRFGCLDFGLLHFMINRLARRVQILSSRPYFPRILVYKRKLGSMQSPIIQSTSLQLTSICTSMDESTSVQVIRTDNTVIHVVYDPQQPPSKPTGSQWTRFVCISDSHCATFPLPSGDILIHAGDMTKTVRGTTLSILNAG